MDGAISDFELIDLAESVWLVGGSIDLGGWPGADDVRVSDGTGLLDEYEQPADPTLVTYKVRGPVSLTASDHGNMPLHFGIGDRVVDINGMTGELTWITADGVLVAMSGTDSDDLLDIARTVRPVEADDERLLEVWDGPSS